MNQDLRRILAEATEALLRATGEAEACVHAVNPAWQHAAEVLGDCLDEVRDLHDSLGDKVE